MFDKVESFSVKINMKKFKSKNHEVNFIAFYDGPQTVNLTFHNDDRRQQILFNIEQAKILLKELTESIEKFESKNQSA